MFLAGPGGVGKTQLAIAYAGSQREYYSSALWLNATTVTTLKESFRRIASLVFPVQNSEDLESDNIFERVQRWLSDAGNTSWLLIFDNYDDPCQFSINEYFPSASHGAVVVTTRRSDLGQNTLHVKPLQDISDSLAILQSRSKRVNLHSGMGGRKIF